MTDILLQCDRTRRRLSTTCSSFLEIIDHDLDGSLLTHLHFSEQQMELFQSGNAIVGFSHRSAADFFEYGQGKEWLNENLVTEHQAPMSDFLKTQVAKVRLLGFPVTDYMILGKSVPWSPRDPNDILLFLCEAEAELGHPPTALCSALDRAMTILHQQRQGSEQTAHWILLADKQSLERGALIDFGSAFSTEPINIATLTSSSGTPVDTLPSPPTILLAGPKDFLGLLAYLGLDLYVEESIKASSSPLSVTDVSYLLSCVLLFLGGETSLEIEKKLRLVGLLLNQGADPNEVAFRGTLWTLFLDQIYGRVIRERIWSENMFQNVSWAAVAKAFLAAGANVHEQISSSETIQVLDSKPHDSISHFNEIEGEIQRGIRYLGNRYVRVQLSVLSCLSHCLSNAPQLPGIQEECIGKGAQYLVEFSHITYSIRDLDGTGGVKSYTISKEQSDRIVPTYEAYVLSEKPSHQKIWAEKEALRQQLMALYHEFVEEEKRRLLPKAK